MTYTFFPLVIASCLVSLMAVFLGVQGTLLGTTLTIQAIVAIIALIVFLFHSMKLAKQTQSGSIVSIYKNTVPGWLWFIFWSINSLMIAGIASIFLANWASTAVVHPLNHAPLVCGLFCMLAITAKFVADHNNQAN